MEVVNKEETEYTVERKFLGRISATEFVRRILKAHMDNTVVKEVDTE